MNLRQGHHLFFLILGLCFLISCSPRLSSQKNYSSEESQKGMGSLPELPPPPELPNPPELPEPPTLPAPGEGISPTPVNPDPYAQYPDLRPSWENKVSEGKKWTQSFQKNLDTYGHDLLDVIPQDYSTFCPKYKNLNLLERKLFWTYFFSEMVKYESGFNPQATYKEDFVDVNGKRIISRGLLQISIESSQGYHCGFTQESQLHDPQKNLACGIKIYNHWVRKDARMAGYVNSSWRGGARYWAVLRQGRGESLKSITSWTRQLKVCQ